MFMADGTGSRLTDVDGNTYIDYLLGLGPMILGHRHPVVTAAVAQAITELGTCFGLPYELEIEAAEKVVAAVPGIEQVRFTNSGSEAVGTAVRLARATTGRRLIVRFEGHYHGWQDTVYWSNHVDPVLAGPADHPRPVAMGPGVPAELEDTLVVLTWNDPESFVAADGRTRRRGCRSADRTRGVQHRLHPARARLPGTAAQRDPQVRCTADLRRGDHRIPVRPRRRPGVVRGDCRTSPPWPRGSAAVSRSPRSAALSRRCG